MKQFSLIYKNGAPYLRVKNPIQNDGRLISPLVWEDFEKQYENEAIKVINPIQGQREYLGNELDLLWRFTEDNGKTWIETSEPNFIGTSPENYEQIFKVKLRKEIPYQERVQTWISDTFDPDQVTNIPERCFRFVEEAIELAQALGMQREDMYRLITRTYGREPGNVFSEIGDVAITLNGLSTAVNIDMIAAAEAGLSNNIKNAQAIREKWLNKIAISPGN